MLNLISHGGTLRASSQLLSRTGIRGSENLALLEDLSVVTYRKFADEYRIWQGTDVDIQSIVDSAHEKLRDQSLCEVISHLDKPQAQVAARHSAEHDVFRVFAKRYARGGEKVNRLSEFSPYDGQVLLVTELDAELPSLASTRSAGKPTLAAIPCDVTSLEKESREVAAMTIALEHPEVESDWVARNELSERVAVAKATLRQTINNTYGGDACRCFQLNLQVRLSCMQLEVVPHCRKRQTGLFQIPCLLATKC